MDTTLTSPFTLLKQAGALAVARPHIVPFLVLAALPQLFSITLSAMLAYASGITDLQTAVSDLFTNGHEWQIAGLIAVGLIGILMVSLVSAWYTALLYRVYQATAGGNLSSLAAYVQPAKRVTVRLLTTFIIVGLLTSLGFLLLIIPGIIIAVRYMFAPMIAAVEDRTVKPIGESKRLVKGRFWKLVGRILVLVVFYNIPRSILQAIHPLFGSLWAISSPIFGLYFFLVYMDFKRTAVVTT